jgi:hypothetical protein
MDRQVTIYELAGQWPDETEPSAWAYAMTREDLPHDGWYNQGAEFETVQRLQVNAGDPRLDSARANLRAEAVGRPTYLMMLDDGETY